jgi:hypothetical protein
MNSPMVDEKSNGKISTTPFPLDTSDEDSNPNRQFKVKHRTRGIK